MTDTALEAFNARADQLVAIYQANPQWFVTEREAVARAKAALESAKQDAAGTIALREKHLAIIEEAHKAGALSDWERGKIFERHATTYCTPNIEEAERTLEATWDSFWKALKKSEQQADTGRI